MKTLEDFNGTKGHEYDCFSGIGGAFTLTYRHGSKEEAEANAKLFANSYKLLEAADSLTQLFKGAHETYPELKSRLEKLEQAIQDCL